MDVLKKETILVVDDSEVNIAILVEALSDQYEVSVSMDGESALEAVNENPPDLILLDILMPGMDGYEVCGRLKKNKVTEKIPIIFVTVKNEVEDETKGFSLGAVDYITKPFKPAIVKARVRTHLDLKMHRDHMEALAEARARQLLHAERLSTLGTLSAGVAHEINNPLTYVLGNSEVIRQYLDGLRSRLADNGDAQAVPAEKLSKIVDECSQLIGGVIDGAEKIAHLNTNMRHFSKREDRQSARIDLRECIANALNLCRYELKRVRVDLDAAPGLPPIQGIQQQIEQVLINLIRNAVDAMESVSEPHLQISVAAGGRYVRVSLDDNGSGISDEDLECIWEAFYTTKTGEKGTGLGLSISKSIIKEHGGCIHGLNRKPSGASFIIDLPFVPGPSDTR